MGWMIMFWLMFALFLIFVQLVRMDDKKFKKKIQYLENENRALNRKLLKLKTPEQLAQEVKIKMQQMGK